jgi:aarF domain-containing kinase
VFIQDFGKKPTEIFVTFDEIPMASASIAQVHLATITRSDGKRKWEETVAVKVQKPAIRKQMEWDLWSYRTLMYLSERIFNMPRESDHNYAYGRPDIDWF